MMVGNVFHAGDGNIHPCIFYDANKPGELERSEEFGGRILELCVEVGGTITGEHGVGIEKLRQMCVQFRAAEIAAFHDVKAAFDPAGILNPGKAVPTLKRCAEWGGIARPRRPHAAPRHPEVLTMAEDFIDDLCERVRRRRAARKAPLRIRGGGTKDFYGGAPLGEAVRHVGATRASSPTSRRSWCSRCAPARRSRRSRRRSPRERQMLAVRAAALRRGRHHRRHRGRGAFGAAPPLCRLGARFRARHAHRQRQGRGPLASAGA